MTTGSFLNAANFVAGLFYDGCGWNAPLFFGI